MRLGFVLLAVASAIVFAGPLKSTSAQTQVKLEKPTIAEVGSRARQKGDARRGALVFFKSAAACSKCHSDGTETASTLGPELTKIVGTGIDGKTVTEEQIAESILHPSKQIKDDFASLRVLTDTGQLVSGMKVRETETQLVLRDASDLDRQIVIDKEFIEDQSVSKVSMMPEGLVDSLLEPRDLYDLVRYVAEVARGGPKRALKLRPSAEQLAVRDDTKNLDHAGILKSLGNADLKSGRQIYFSHCVNCHGADGNTPTLPTARAFGTDKLKYGSDPLRMLGTLTKGNGLMGAMQHLSPKERYQVIHFIRTEFMKGANPGYSPIDAEYLASLPKGTDTGELLVSGDRDYGPVLGSQLGNDINNSLTFRLPNGVTVNYDLHRFNLGGVWKGGFLDLSQTQHYRQRGERMPQPGGTPLAGLGEYAWELDGSFVRTEEHKPTRGPVHDDLAKYHGHYLHGDQAVISYDIAGRGILETISGETVDDLSLIHHTYRIAPGDKTLRLSIGRQDRGQPSDFVSAGHIAFVPVTSAEKVSGPSHTNEAVHILGPAQAKPLDLGTPGRTVLVRFKTASDGTLIASTPRNGIWEAGGKTLFIRGNRLVFDIGWVGAINGKTKVTDNQWHTAAVVVTEDETRLYVDGILEGRRAEFRRDAVAGHVLKLGATATNFGGDYRGEFDWAAIVDQAMPAKRIKAVSQTTEAPKRKTLWTWTPNQPSKPKTPSKPVAITLPEFAAAGLLGDVDGLTLAQQGKRLVLTIPPSNRARVFRLVRSAIKSDQQDNLKSLINSRRDVVITDPIDMTKGGPARWPKTLSTAGIPGESINGYALDTVSIPFENPWNAWMRTSALDFFDDGRCVVTTHGGDVYLVSGLDADLKNVTWKRFAAGFFEPFGVRVVDGQIYVTCRDGLKRLHDFDGNGEADFVEAFWIDDDVSSMFHAYNFDLQTDSKGNFYFAKAGQYTRHHRPGTIMRVPPEGGRADVIAWGLRTPNGMGKLDDDRFTVSDNQGPWMPAGKVSLIKPDGFYGNMPLNKEQDAWLREKYDGELPTTFDEPFIWTPQELDSSCGGQAWAGDKRWGPLSGRLIHSSFGKGWLYYLSLQEVDTESGEQTQASIVTLPHQWDAGVMRLRVNPADGQMYGVGLSGWQGPKGGKDGCLQRLRFTGDQVRMIERVTVTAQGIKLDFNFEVSGEAVDTTSWDAQMWNYLWSRKYGSDQFSVLDPEKTGRDPLKVTAVEISPDRRSVTLVTPTLQICDQVRIEMNFADSKGDDFGEEVYLTVHGVPEK